MAGQTVRKQEFEKVLSLLTEAVIRSIERFPVNLVR